MEWYTHPTFGLQSACSFSSSSGAVNPWLCILEVIVIPTPWSFAVSWSLNRHKVKETATMLGMTPFARGIQRLALSPSFEDSCGSSKWPSKTCSAGGFDVAQKGSLVWSEGANHPNHSNPSINTNAHGTRPKSMALYVGIHHLKGYGWFLPLCHLGMDTWPFLVDLNCGIAKVQSHIKLAPCSDCPTASWMASSLHAQFCAHAPRVREFLSHVFPIPITTMTRKKVIEKSGWVRSF